MSPTKLLALLVHRRMLAPELARDALELAETMEPFGGQMTVMALKLRAGCEEKRGDAAGFDPSLVSVSGTVEGGVYRHRAAHFEWLLDVGESVGLEFNGRAV